MKRLYYLSQDLEDTRQISEDLHQAGITDWHFRVICKHPEGLYQQHIHSANPLHRLDVIHCGQQGALTGAVFGLVLASSLLLLNPPGYPTDLKMFALIISICALIGAWIGASSGLSHQNYKISRFHERIEAGQYLLIIDIKKAQEEAVIEVMQKHPHAIPAGQGSSFTNPFQDQEPLDPQPARKR
ncbi:hypothetical protein [Motiliproteus sp. MSK22-1]|uniref:hypothetical protein n=1 Tax=Motiliproteus sp. MSK22-1 TaxID=1897630 RepID=UPI000975A044|nr:hypothetical protein [Motiliproteus sp. MSK22-1]OMH30073.1 hypothetical protein BGP75_19275 [Motiliproteus sp. MSK22-1]